MRASKGLLHVISVFGLQIIQVIGSLLFCVPKLKKYNSSPGLWIKVYP